MRSERQAPSIVGTGRSFAEGPLLTGLLSPGDDPRRKEVLRTREVAQTPSHLWAVVGGKRFQKTNGAPVVPLGGVAMSPDGQFLVTQIPVPEVPVSWETLYPPPNPTSAYRIKAGVASRRNDGLW